MSSLINLYVLQGSQRLVLLCLGELGRRRDLSEYGDIESVLTASLSDPSEEIQSAASFALGAITFGNLGRYLSNLLERIKASVGTPKLYLLLQALNEVIRSVEKVNGMQFSEGKILWLLDFDLVTHDLSPHLLVAWYVQPYAFDLQFTKCLA